MTQNLPSLNKAPIMIMAGGTGGHIFPALAVAECLREAGIPLLWLGTERGLEARIVPEHGLRLLTLSIGGLRGKGLITKLIAPFKLLHAIGQALIMMRKHQPAAVLGMGGFASGPGGLAAWLCRKPLVIHEQNAIAGMTNRYLSKLANVVFEAFPNTFPASTQARAVGNPVRAAIVEAESEAHEGLNLLIVGGSLGASKLNAVVPDVVAALQQTQPALAVWHQTGQHDEAQVQAAYAERKIEARAKAFIKEMADAYAWADLVICRAGALTISELAAAGKPAILVPYPHAVDDHQTRNAAYLVDSGAAILIADQEVNSERLVSEILPLMQDAQRLKSMGKKAHEKAMSGASQIVADTLKTFAEKAVCHG